MAVYSDIGVYAKYIAFAACSKCWGVCVRKCLNQSGHLHETCVWVCTVPVVDNNIREGLLLWR